MFSIENDTLKVTIHPKGAELTSLFHKTNKIDYMWGADPAFWGKTSPVLFPIVGGLKDNTYYFQDKKYTLPRHGFARDQIFEQEEWWDEGVTFLLHSDENTLKNYPFPFELRLTYELYANLLSVTYHVTNIGEEEMYFSVGGHPAFTVPLAKGLNYQDYYLEFDQTEDFQRWPLTDKGLIEEAPEVFLENTNRLPLTKELFYQDALVFKKLQSTNVILKSDKSANQLKFDFTGFPFLGIWAAKDANFVCIEPWCGIADSVSHSQELTQKEGICTLAAGDVFERAWAVKLS